MRTPMRSRDRLAQAAERTKLAAGVATGGGTALCALTAVWLGAGLDQPGWGVLVALAGGAGVAVFSERRARAHLALVESLDRAARDLAEGGQLVPLALAEAGPFSGVVDSVNRLTSVLSGAANRVLDLVARVSDLPARITESMEGVQASADAQEEAVEETASLIATLDTSIRDINAKVDKLSRSAEESASSILQMGSSIDEVARNAGTLNESVEGSTSAVHQMGASIRQVADSSENVERMAEETASSMTEMDRSVQQVGEHVKRASVLTEEVSQGATEGGEAVEATIADIETIRARTEEATEVLERLVGRIGEIGRTLSVIGEINDETNLLSLNAAIIAAQAGEQGRAFLVVANHVKTLAQRTASSTEEIERVIQAVHTESENAVTAMNAGREAIAKGVDRSRVAGSALDRIRESSGQAAERVAEIARATEEQTRNSKLVARAAQETSVQVQQISQAIAEQSRASDQMLKSSEAALEICRHVHRSTDEQRETGRYINEAISSITEMIRGIQQSTGAHARSSDAMSEAVTRLLGNAQKSASQIPEVQGMVKALRSNAEQIIGELSRFELRNAGDEG